MDTCQYKTWVTAALPRTDCPDCGVKTVVPPWAADHRARFTWKFETHAISVLKNAHTITNACRILSLTWDQVDNIKARAVQRGLSRRDLSGLRRIGIDVKAVLKGQNYVIVVTDLDTSKVIWVGQDRTKASLHRFFTSLPAEVIANIECIAMDMYEGFRTVCQEWIPDADKKIVIDRFHVQKHMNEAVDTVRKQEHKALSRQGDGDLLKGTKYLWLSRSPENLSEDHREIFETLRKCELKTARAYAMKQSFDWFWYYRYPACAKRFFENWYNWAIHSQLEAMAKQAKRMKRHLPWILNFIVYGVTNAVAEGINSKIQGIKKAAYGFRNVQRFINAIYFHCGGLELNPR
mgnify:CR=1 FL=1